MNPAAIPSSFTARLLQLNHLEAQGFQRWSWRPGMLFAAARTWWGEEAARTRAHEGLDICLFIDSAGRCRSLAAGTVIPIILAGEVLAVFADFLGYSIVVAHRLQQGSGWLHSVYAHVLPEPGVTPGHRCQAGEAIARIAPSLKSGAPPSHLHLTTFWFSEIGSEAEPWSWSRIADATHIRLCDPLEFIDRPLSGRRSGPA